MRTGSPAARWRGFSRAVRPRGFTYLLLLFAVAIGAAGLAALGSAWSTAAQRGREAELRFRGDQFARALASYQAATPSGQPGAPRQLEELLDDRRGLAVRRHLRRVYPDPFTGAADWLIERDGEFIRALHSRAEAPLFGAASGLAPGATARATDWWFSADGAAAEAAASSPLSPRSRPP